MPRRWRAWLVMFGCLLLPLVMACASNEITGQVVQNSLVVTATCPESGDSLVALRALPHVQFDQPPTPTEETTTTFGVEHDGALVAGSVVKLGDRWVFVPAQPLSPHGRYDCSVGVGVRLEQGRLVRDFVRWSFRTGDAAAVDTCQIQ